MSASSPILLIFIGFLLLLGTGIIAINLINWRRTRERELLSIEKRRSSQLTLLEETGRIIADSFDEKEILQRAINSIIHRFGYVIAAISVLNKDNYLEVTAIAGSDDFGYKPGFMQKLGEGIIGHTAQLQKTYVTNNVAKDSYYFSSGAHFGSAICTPILKQGVLYGVLYIESLESNTFDELDIKALETLARQISGALQRATLYKDTQENLRILSIIQNISKTITSSLEKEMIARQVISELQKAFGYTHLSIYMLEEDYLNILAEIGYPDKEMVYEKMHISQGVHGRAIRTKTVQYIEDTRKDDVYLTADTTITSEICAPLLKEDNVIGTINIESDHTRKLTPTDVNIITTVASTLAIAIDNARLHEEIKKLATTDAVTGLSNRHVFEQMLSAEVERAQRLVQDVSLIVFDIDNFKEFNDTYGHPAGDARLREVANLIKNNLRKYDVAARYGGDEFAIILSNTNEEHALAFANRLHESAQQGATQNENAGYTLSMGIATLPQDATTHNELLIAADNAALRSKHLGKNRIILASQMNQ